MAWPRKFLAVPSSALTIDETLHLSGKATSEELKVYMRNVPEIYARLQQNFTDVDFRRMSSDPLNNTERDIADTYHHLFSTSPTAERIEAEFIDGRGLIVTRGRHRVHAAQDERIEYIPVHVRASEQHTLDRLSNQLESEVSRFDPAVVEAHRMLDGIHRQSRGERMEAQREISPDPERSHERNRGHER